MNPNRSLVSVIIPAYNDSRYLGVTISSVLAQTYRPVEILVIDDGSTDGSAAVARGCGASVRVIEQPNRGSASARNRGLDEAAGEYIAFLDGDDYWHPAKLESQMRHLQNCGECVAVYCNKIEVGNSVATAPWTNLPEARDLDRVSDDPRCSGSLYVELLRRSIVHTSTVLAPRSTLNHVGRFDESLRKGQDLEYWLRLSRLGPIHMLDAILSAYRIHSASISHRTMATNYHAQVVERTVARYGPGDTSGQALARGELARILGASWFEFAYQQFRAGSVRLSRQSVSRSLDYYPYRLGAWRLAIRAALKSLVRRN